MTGTGTNYKRKKANMTDAQLMEEELQHSVSAQDVEHDDDSVDGDISMGNGIAYSGNSRIDLGTAVDEAEEDDEMGDDEDDDDEREERGEDDGMEDEDGSGSDEQNSESGSESEDDAFEDDAEGEDDEDVRPQHFSAQRRIPSIEDDDDEDDEGVGAVKIKPGETDEDEDDDDDSSAGSVSGSPSISDVDSDGPQWEDTQEHDRHDDEESDNANPNNCIFCRQDEDHDPAPEFEVFLSCSGCGDNAHQQCARDAKALSTEQGPENWKCPECADDDSDGAADEDDIGDLNSIVDANAPPKTRRAAAPKLARDLLPPPKASADPDSHSVFNQLVLDEDPLDGSRVLRKRKTSSAEVDEYIVGIRRRRRNTGDEQANDDLSNREEATRPVSSRSLRLKVPNPPVTIMKKEPKSIILKLRVNASELRQITSRKPKGPEKKRSHKAGAGRSSRNDAGRASRPSAPAPPPVAVTPFTSASYSQPFYSFYDKETDELKGKPYGGILTQAEADTSKTMPTNDDRRRFDEAKQKAEEEWRQRLLKMQAEIELPAKKSKKSSGPASQIECIEFGGWEIDTWYAAPYPEEYSRNRVLYICEFCLKYMNSDYVAWRHKLKCPAKHPPGDEIYRHGSVSVFEVDGRKNPVYCQNLCLLAKLFLGSKTLYYDVEPFLFYVLCEYDDLGYHFVGYFSKEKRASSQNNVSCILTLPIHQRKGYGNLLIDFSYLLTRVEKKTGSPEKPLSDMGLVSYRNYWRLIMCRYLLEHSFEDALEKKGLSIKKISDDTGLTPDDVISALEGLRCLVRDPQTQVYAFRVDQQYCHEYIKKWESKNYVQLNPKALIWTPYVMGRSNATNFELGPALNAIAPREEEEEHKVVVPVRESLVNGTGSQPQPDSTKEESKMDIDPTVLESTEPNETGDMRDEGVLPGEPAKPNGIFVNGEALREEARHEAKQDRKNPSDDWTSQYKDIPPSRFEVVPPIAGSRRADRVRTAVSRPPPIRTASTIPRPRPKRPSGSSRRSSAAKPKSSSSGSKRKSGGTGRGPGRWPKGTKKSDYGNADSGPGLPPGWVVDRNKLAIVTGGGKKEGSGAKDTVQVQTPTVKEAKSQTSSRRTGSIGDSSVSKGRASPRSQSEGKEDIVMRDAEGADDDDEEEEE
ncbi:hypothetical protein B0H63DRAFT_561236 [Podospora didyma]|uniref:Histone acetyltransferase n=1 Tax=Podospora didyma TaxID=330526 RepID=A0AAE0TVX4_9PEZI|nr:hypothetical protein B0H63DRAFT_561236 [Podospora didyma]